MKTATKSSWSKVTQDLYGRWFVQGENEAKKETNKHRNGILSAARSCYIPPNLRLTISTFFYFSSNAVRPAGDGGKHTYLFCSEFLHTIFRKLSRHLKYFSIQEKSWERLDLVASANSPGWMETSVAPACPHKGTAEAQKTEPNGYNSVFSQKEGLIRFFRPLFVTQMKQDTYWDQVGLRLRGCASAWYFRAGHAQVVVHVRPLYCPMYFNVSACQRGLH